MDFLAEPGSSTRSHNFHVVFILAITVFIKKRNWELVGHQVHEKKEKHGSFTIDKEFACIHWSWMPFPRIFNLIHTHMYVYTYIYTHIYSTPCHTISLLIMSKSLWHLILSRLIHIYIKNISQRAENCLMETECWVSIAWGCLAIMLHEIRHSLFQLLKIRSHEKWQRRRKKPSPFSVLWYLNYEIRNYMMWRNQWNLLWNSGGPHCISLEL